MILQLPVIIRIVHRMMVVDVLICLIILTLTIHSVCVHSKVITVNNNNKDNNKCCVNGECACSSLSTALLNIDNNTIINITSESVALINSTTMGSGKLTNITITGSNVTIMCNNSGSVYCESCDDVMIEGITWDRCGDPNGTNIAAVTFNGTSNISLVNCTFQHSQVPTVHLLEVSNSIFIQRCNFLTNIPLQKINDFDFSIFTIKRTLPGSQNITIAIYESYFYKNGYSQSQKSCQDLSTVYIYISYGSVVNCDIIVSKTTFISNTHGLFIANDANKLANIQLMEISVYNNNFLSGLGKCAGFIIRSNSFNNDVVLSIVSSYFSGNYGSNVFLLINGNNISVTINKSRFSDSKIAGETADSIVGFRLRGNVSEIIFDEVEFNDNVIKAIPHDPSGVAGITTLRGDVKIYMHKVNFTSNQYLGDDGGALFILDNGDILQNSHTVLIEECKFVNNTSLGHGAALYINPNDFLYSYIKIVKTIFDKNIGGSSVVYITQYLVSVHSDKTVQVSTSEFTNNVASSMYLSSCNVKFLGTLIFRNGTAKSGGAMYLNQGSTVTIKDNTAVQFVANTAILNGGAIYVDLGFNCYYGKTTFVKLNTSSEYSATFINNSARNSGNSLYINLPRSCSVNTNISNSSSILHLPCQFNYSQLVNRKMMHIPCDLDYTLLNGTGAPIVTSPYELRLYFPFNDGYNISSPSEHNKYFVRNSILGQLKFTGAVFDYFGKPTQSLTFSLHCLGISKCPTYSVINNKYLHYQTVDNFTILSVNIIGKRINFNSINVSIALTSLSYSYVTTTIDATLVVELVPCADHPGYTYSEESRTCVCYHDNVKCGNDGNEIKRGYWFGSIASEATTSLCPNHYCKFTGRKQISEGYFELPNTINAQCNDYRVGRACGECSSGYILSYDSTDCISVHQCGAGWTMLVITLTCLYWIAVVVGVFSLMYFRSQISLGYLYGLIIRYAST